VLQHEYKALVSCGRPVSGWPNQKPALGHGAATAWNFSPLLVRGRLIHCGCHSAHLWCISKCDKQHSHLRVTRIEMRLCFMYQLHPSPPTYLNISDSAMRNMYVVRLHHLDGLRRPKSQSLCELERPSLSIFLATIEVKQVPRPWSRLSRSISAEFGHEGDTRETVCRSSRAMISGR